MVNTITFQCTSYLRPLVKTNIENSQLAVISEAIQANRMVNAVIVNVVVFDLTRSFRNGHIPYTIAFFLFFFGVKMTSTSLVMIIPVIVHLYAWYTTPIGAANLKPANLDGLKAQFRAAMKSFSNVASLHYTLAGIKELDVQPPDSFCDEIKKLVDKSNIESIYHGTEAANTLTNCKVYIFEAIFIIEVIFLFSYYFSCLLKIIVQH